MNITIPTGGAGGTAGGKGSSGSSATIVGNTSATTYLSAAGGGGGGGGAAANLAGIVGASGGGDCYSGGSSTGGGGGMGGSANGDVGGLLGGTYSTNSYPSLYQGGGALPTTAGITGYSGGNANSGPNYGGVGITVMGRAICGGGHGYAILSAVAENFGTGVASALYDVVGPSATANTGAGGTGGRTDVATARAGGAGGSGLVVLRYVV